MAIGGISNIIDTVKLNPTKIQGLDGEEQQGKVQSFGEYFNNALGSVNQLQLDSEQAGIDFAAGKTDSIHEVMIAGEKADIALQLTMQIRNKVVEAYNEIMRMQI